MNKAMTFGQADPIPNDYADIQSLVMADIAARREHGIRTYGTPLQPFNLRNAFRDLYEEQLDAAMYTKQILVELDDLGITSLSELRQLLETRGQDDGDPSVQS